MRLHAASVGRYEWLSVTTGAGLPHIGPGMTVARHPFPVSFIPGKVADKGVNPAKPRPDGKPMFDSFRASLLGQFVSAMSVRGSASRP